MKILNNKKTIKTILSNHPEARDNDLRLYYLCCLENRVDIGGLNGVQMLERMRIGRIPHWESVSRCRRKVQEENPHLRGQSYFKRQVAQEEVKEELGY